MGWITIIRYLIWHKLCVFSSEVGLGVPPELAQLYELYQQEIHASTYTESNDIYTPPYRLPPISTRSVRLRSVKPQAATHKINLRPYLTCTTILHPHVLLAIKDQPRTVNSLTPWYWCTSDLNQSPLCQLSHWSPTLRSEILDSFVFIVT